MATEITSSPVSETPYAYMGLSSETKPTENIPNGTSYFEMDTSSVYLFDKVNSVWREI